MISAEHFRHALQAIQRHIIHAKSQAYEVGVTGLAELLNDVELLPEYLADEHDRTGEFVEMLQGIAGVYPNGHTIVEEFERASAPTT